MGAPVGLHVQSGDVDDAHDLDGLGQQVGGRSDHVRDGKCLSTGQFVGADRPIPANLGIAGLLDRLLESRRDLVEVEVEPPGERIHVRPGNERAEIPEHHRVRLESERGRV